jgi:excisionase family DNA binding protein
MEKKYYTVEEAAAILGATPAEVNQKRERNEIRGFRDGASWKFRTEDVETLVRQLRAKRDPVPPPGDDADVVLSDLTLDGSDSEASGTVIGPVGRPSSDSDIQLADSGLNIDLAADDEGSGTVARVPSKPSGSDIEITLDDDVLVDEKQADLGEDSGTVANVPPPRASGKSGSDLALAAASGGSSKKLDDDDIVLGGGSSGSDITIGGDSGISLLDPTDSGLSLEEPLELDRMDEDSLELGDDDMLTFADDTGSSVAPTPLKKDEEFLLTPLEEVADEEESESGSQVIALDTAPTSDATATMLGPAVPGMSPASAGLGLPPMGGPGMTSMLDEDFAASTAAAPALAAAVSAPAISPLGTPMAAQPMFSPEGAPIATALPEAPYTNLNIVTLCACFLFILLAGVFTFDLMRNMWSWNGNFTVTGLLMDFVVNLIG